MEKREINNNRSRQNNQFINEKRFSTIWYKLKLSCSVNWYYLSHMNISNLGSCNCNLKRKKKCVCVCVCVREREKERERDDKIYNKTKIYQIFTVFI